MTARSRPNPVHLHVESVPGEPAAHARSAGTRRARGTDHPGPGCGAPGRSPRARSASSHRAGSRGQPRRDLLGTPRLTPPPVRAPGSVASGERHRRARHAHPLLGDQPTDNSLDAVVLAVDRVPAVALVAGDAPAELARFHEIADAGDGALQAELHPRSSSWPSSTSSARIRAETRAAGSLVSTISSDRPVRVTQPRDRWSSRWARQGSNLRPLGCKPSALPLSYAPLAELRKGPARRIRPAVRPPPSSNPPGRAAHRAGSPR
jgi:hypothetical protein